MSTEKEPEILSEITHNGKVGTIWFNRPNKGNALTREMNSLFLEAVEKLSNDPRIRVIIISGKGKFFCTGMDLSAGNQSKVRFAAKNQLSSNPMVNLLDSLKNSPKPIIARINGDVMGGGNGFIFACDFKISLKKNNFSFPEVKRGICPAIISAYIVPQLGSTKSIEYFILGNKISTDQLFSDGIITKIAENENDLDLKIDNLIEELLTSAPKATSDIKKLVNFVSKNKHEDNIIFAEKLFSEMVQSEEAKYGIGSFIQRKKPNWDEFLKSKL